MRTMVIPGQVVSDRNIYTQVLTPDTHRRTVWEAPESLIRLLEDHGGNDNEVRYKGNETKVRVSEGS